MPISREEGVGWAKTPLNPVRLCCGQRHSGPVCPDGLVMCCLCFNRVPTDQLRRDADGQLEDVCLACESLAGDG